MPRRTIVSPRFGVRLRELREERDLSLRELARKVPCSHVHISDMENRKKDPSPEMAVRLDEVLATGGELTALASATASPAEPWRPRADSFSRNDAEELAAALVAVTPTADNAPRLAHEWMVAEPPQVYEARAGRRISASTVAQVEHRVGQLRLLDDHIGGADTYAVVTKELVATGALLRETSFTAPVGKRLLVALGELALCSEEPC